MNILGITCFGHDSAAAIVKDGELLAAVEEERFNRVKHASEFPIHSINYCLEKANIDINDIDHVGFYLKPWIGYHHYFIHFLKYFPQSLSLVSDRETAKKSNDNIAFGPLTNPVDLLLLPRMFKKYYPQSNQSFKFHFIEHHVCHQASSFYISPFEESACLSVDGAGEWATTTFAHGVGNKLKVIKKINSPNSLGVFYNSVCSYLGFGVLDGPGKVMGLASYGDRDIYYDKFKKLISLTSNGGFEIDLSYFNFHIQRTKERFTDKFVDLFGEPRQKDAEMTKHHMDVASALQRITEDVMLHMAGFLKKETSSVNICLSGGVALNSVANGAILKTGMYENVFIQPAASDSGCSVGACFHIYNSVLGQPRKYVFGSALTGKEFTAEDINVAIDKSNLVARKSDDITGETAQYLADGKIIGWFQGQAEFGPRALGNRSILADPRRAEMKDILNKRVKHREGFRPFAPSVLAEKAAEYFDIHHESPYMLLVFDVLNDKRSIIPAVTHVDNTARVQTVEKDVNPLYWELIKEFENITNVPVLLNTSFNVKGMPIVNSPEDAIQCFLSTDMDYLIMGDMVASKPA